MAAEGKSPLKGPIINIPAKEEHFDLWGLDDVVDEHEWVRIPRLDAHIVVIAKLNGHVFFMVNDGSPCLSEIEPGIRKAHWYLSSNFYAPVMNHMENGWIIAGFWTYYARTWRYDFSSPFQVFEIVNTDGAILPYNHMRIWCETLGMQTCPTVERHSQGLSEGFPDGVFRHRQAICRKETVLPDVVSERFLWTVRSGDEISSERSLATTNMPFGLIQCELPPPKPDSQQMKITPILKQLGLPY